MTGLDVYKDYIALKSHFYTKKYDYIKNNGRIRASIKSFHKRNDKVFFEKLSKRKDFHTFLLFNLLETNNWIGEIVINKSSLDIYKKHKKFIQNLTYSFQIEIKKVNFPGDFIIDKNEYPEILKKLIRNEINYETLSLLSYFINFLDYWNEKFPNDVFISPYIMKISKYIKFLKFNENRIINIIEERISESMEPCINCHSNQKAPIAEGDEHFYFSKIIELNRCLECHAKRIREYLELKKRQERFTANSIPII